MYKVYHAVHQGAPTAECQMEGRGGKGRGGVFIYDVLLGEGKGEEEKVTEERGSSV